MKNGFPLKNPPLLQKWILATRRTSWQPSKYSTICSEHFSTDAYKLPMQCHLKNHAVPTIFDLESNRQSRTKGVSIRRKQRFFKDFSSAARTRVLPTEGQCSTKAAVHALCLPSKENKSMLCAEVNKVKNDVGRSVKATDLNVHNFLNSNNYTLSFSLFDEWKRNCAQKPETRESSVLEASPLTAIKVTNLPEGTSDSDLHLVFGTFGNIEKIYFVKSRKTGVNKVLAFIKYADHEHASRALIADGFKFGQNMLKVELAKLLSMIGRVNKLLKWILFSQSGRYPLKRSNCIHK